MVWRKNTSKSNKSESFATGSTSLSTTNQQQNDPIFRTDPAVFVGRAVFIGMLMLVAACFGYLSFHFLAESEVTLTIEQFKAIADRAACSARENMERKRLGILSVASVIAGANPYSSQWPLVSVTNFENITSNIIDTSKGCYMGFAPLVKPEEAAEFEEHAYKYFEEERVPEPFPNGTGYSSFGKGIFSVNKELQNTDQRYHDIDGETAWGSPNKILAPLFQHATGPNKKLMMNWHSSPLLGRMIDNMMVCAEEKAQTGGSIEACTDITQIMPDRTSWVQGAETGPGSLMMQPVYPATDPQNMTGIMVTSVVWGEIMMGTYSSAVNGIHIVLSDGETSWTYNVVHGEAKVVGKGDLHLKKYESYGCKIDLTPVDMFGDTSYRFTMMMFPTDELYEVYRTRNPIAASTGAIVIIALTSLLFLLYDRFVRREFNAKKELLAAKRKFVRFVSHEVRTPLNSVCMGLALLQDEMQAAAGPDADNKSMSKKTVSKWLGLTDEVLIGARSSVDVLNDFLNYDKIESGKLSLELGVIRILELIEKTCDEFQLPAQKKKLKFTTKTPLSDHGLDKNECFVIGDSIRLTQVVRNLISNAIKFTPEHGDIEVLASFIPLTEEQAALRKETNFTLQSEEELSVKKRGHLLLTVTDSGAGMTSEQVEQVFSQGTQFNANALQGGNGSGLGTWIAKGIVRQHNGTLKAASEGLNQGSTFSLSLPVFDVPNELQPAPEKKRSKDDLQENLGSLHILVVDDAKMNLKLLMRLLSKSGHTCDGAEDGLIALEKVKESMEKSRPYDAILMDYQMPRMDGPTASSAIRELGSDAFIVGVTGNVMQEDVRHFKLHGANHVLPKPLKVPDLEALFVEYDIREDTFKTSNSSNGTPMPAINFDMSEREPSPNEAFDTSKRSTGILDGILDASRRSVDKLAGRWGGTGGVVEESADEESFDELV